jgi:hypothetical protein
MVTDHGNKPSGLEDFWFLLLTPGLFRTQMYGGPAENPIQDLGPNRSRLYCYKMDERIILAVGIISTGLFSTQVLARTVPGSHGKAVNHADAGCFSMWYGTIRNKCGTDATRTGEFFPDEIALAGSDRFSPASYTQANQARFPSRSVALDAQPAVTASLPAAVRRLAPKLHAS